MVIDNEPLVSIITINYNCKNYIQQHIDSVININYNNWEHIFVDCGSNDGSIEIVKNNTHSRLLFYEIKFCTVSEARNFAIENSNGTICAILDSDDLMCKNRLTRQINLLNSDTSNILVGGNFVGIMNRSNVLAKFLFKRRVEIKMPDDKIEIQLLINSAFLPFPHSTFTFFKDSFIKAGKYNIDKSEDYELLLNLSKLGSIAIVSDCISIINFGRINSHSSSYKPNNRTPLHFAFFILVKDSIKNSNLIFSNEHIHKELDNFSNIQLLVNQTKWLIKELIKSDKIYKLNNLIFITKLLIKNVNTFNKILYFIKCANSKNDFIKSLLGSNFNVTKY